MGSVLSDHLYLKGFRHTNVGSDHHFFDAAEDLLVDRNGTVIYSSETDQGCFEEAQAALQQLLNRNGNGTFTWCGITTTFEAYTATRARLSREKRLAAYQKVIAQILKPTKSCEGGDAKECASKFWDAAMFLLDIAPRMHRADLPEDALSTLAETEKLIAKTGASNLPGGWSRLGLVYAQLGHGEKAVATFTEAIRTLGSIERNRLRALCINDIAEQLAESGLPPDQAQPLLRGLHSETKRSKRSPINYAASLGNIAVTAAKLGLAEMARELFREAEGEIQTSSPPGVHKALSDLAYRHGEAGYTKEAVDLFNRSIDKARGQPDDSALFIVSLICGAGLGETAIPLLEKAVPLVREVKDPTSRGVKIVILAEYITGEDAGLGKKALPLLDQLTTEAQEIPDAEVVQHTLHELKKIRHQLGR